MSIKTSKRIALGVIASLVFAPFAAIAPASATEVAGDIDGMASAVVKPSARVGVTVEIDTTITFAATAATTDRPEIASQLSAKPAGSNSAVTMTLGSLGTTDLEASEITYAAGSVSVPARATIAPGTTGDFADNETLTLRSTFTPDQPGSYSLRTWFDVDSNNAIDVGETTSIITIVVAADAPTISLTVFGSSTATSTVGTDNDTGALVRVNLKNGGEAASLSGLESFTVAIAGSTTAGVRSSTDAAGLTTLTRASFNEDGYAYFRVKDSAASTVTATVTGAAGTNVASLSASTSITFAAAAADLESAVAIVNTTGVGGSTLAKPAANATGAMALTVDPAKTTTVSVSGETGAASESVTVTITDTAAGDITGLGGAIYTVLVKSGTDKAITIPGPAFTPSAAAQAYTMAFLNNGTGLTTVTVTATAAAAATATLTPTSIRAVKGSTVSVTYTVKDGYGIAFPNKTVTATVQASGRNTANAVVVNLVTDANGTVSYSLKDNPTTASSVLTTDSVVITDGTSPKTLTIVWVDSLGVDKVVVTTPNTTAGVANATVVSTDINAGATGAQATLTEVSAKVTDANGVILAGVPVTWTITGAGAAVLSTTATTTTDSAGIAKASVYGWKAGAHTIKASADGKEGTGSITFAQATNTEVRTISAVVTGNTITAKAVDRFGNGVLGVKIYAKRTAGNGYFGSGVLSTNGDTDANGEVSFVIAGADATFSISAVDPAAAAGTTYGQTCAAVGFVSCAATAKALEAPVVGTALVAEKNVGNDIAPAGVSSATAAVTGITPPVVVPPVVYEKPTLSVVQSGGRIFLSGTAEDGEGDIIIYVKRVGTTAWKERARTFEVAAPGDFNGSIKAPRGNVVIRVKQEGTGLFSNQVIIVK